MDGASSTSGCLVLAPSSSALAVLPDAGRTRTLEELCSRLDRGDDVRTVVLGPDLELATVVDLVASYRAARPDVAFVLERRHVRADQVAEALGAGVREVVPVGDLSALAAAVARSQVADDSGAFPVRALSTPDAVTGPEPRRGRVVTVFSAKGGCGKTTLCTNLGAALADGGQRSVVVVDLDVSLGDVAIALNLFPATTLADAVRIGAQDLDFEQLADLLTPHSPGLSALLAPSEHQRPGTVPPAMVGRILDVLSQHVDHVVVDTPPILDAQVLAALDRSDAVVLLATLDIAALRHLKLTLDTLELLDCPQDRVKIVLNRADSQVGLAVREVERTLGRPISAQLPSSRDVPASVNLGVPLVLQHPRHPFSLAVLDLVQRELADDRTARVLDLREDPDEVRWPADEHPHGSDEAVGRARRPAPH